MFTVNRAPIHPGLLLTAPAPLAATDVHDGPSHSPTSATHRLPMLTFPSPHATLTGSGRSHPQPPASEVVNSVARCPSTLCRAW